MPCWRDCASSTATPISPNLPISGPPEHRAGCGIGCRCSVRSDVQGSCGERLIAPSVLPVWDMEPTVEEMTRLREKGNTGFTVTDKPHVIGLLALDAPYFAPM